MQTASEIISEDSREEQIAQTGILFSETMSGMCQWKPQYTVQEEQSSLAITVDVCISNLDQWNDSAISYKGTFEGTVRIGSWKGKLTDGSVSLFDKDHSGNASKVMYYGLSFEKEGEQYTLEGKKYLGNNILKMWWETTTLKVIIKNEQQVVVGEGTLRLSPQAFMKQLSTMRAVVPSNKPAKRLKVFSAFIAGFTIKLLTAYR
ncbi:hypothetical protein [Algivirga pacifica]|uniref:Uncharacterized protein n=1 Tax=Algivirga pacifica TaxID=1162670 RepID=A0ABP9D1C4_9BACT